MTDRATLELTALLDTLDEVDPMALTSCPGWTAHHLAAHIAGNYEEVRLHVEAFADEQPLTRTRSWEEREASLRELDHAALLKKISEEGSLTSSVVADVLDDDPNASLEWTKRTVPISGFLTHMRSEDALHRWDLVGDDELSEQLLSQPDLLHHAITFIGRPLCQRGVDAGAARNDFIARVRSAGQDDLVVQVADGEPHLMLEPQSDDADIEGDQAARLLLLWGRKPEPFNRLHKVGSGRSADDVQFLLSGY
jgi:uncharacterized protein (TIGR03083 family)